MKAKRIKKLSICRLILLLSVLTISSIQLCAQTDSCICGEKVKGVLILQNDASANHEAYLQEHKTRLADSSNYTHTINGLESSLFDIHEALKIEQAMPKVIVKANPDWWKFGLGGIIIGGLVYFITEHFILKK